jgi:hypothetical protein
VRRMTLLLLLATTATCYGQSNADIPADQPSSGSSYIDDDRPGIEQSNEETAPIEQGSDETGSIKRRNEETGRIEQSREETGRAEQGREEAGRTELGGEETGRVEQSSEETERVEQNNAETEHFYRIREEEETETLRRRQQSEDTFNAPVRHNLGRQYKQNERSSIPSTRHADKSKLTYHTTPAPHKQSLESSKKSSNQPSGKAYQDPKGNTNRN